MGNSEKIDFLAPTVPWALTKIAQNEAKKVFLAYTAQFRTPNDALCLFQTCKIDSLSKNILINHHVAILGNSEKNNFLAPTTPSALAKIAQNRAKKAILSLHGAISESK